MSAIHVAYLDFIGIYFSALQRNHILTLPEGNLLNSVHRENSTFFTQGCLQFVILCFVLTENVVIVSCYVAVITYVEFDQQFLGFFIIDHTLVVLYVQLTCKTQ